MRLDYQLSRRFPLQLMHHSSAARARQHIEPVRAEELLDLVLGFQLPFSVYLQRPHMLTGRLDLDKRQPPAGQEDDAIRHTIPSRGDELGAQPTLVLHSLRSISFQLLSLALLFPFIRGW